jgi:hypothetical protein
MNWTYKNKIITSIEDLPDYEYIIGFVYRITRISDGLIYIGKKSLQHSRKVRISKKEKLLTQSRKVFKVVRKESDWKTYWGSCKELSDHVKINPNNFKREILELCCSKKYLNFCELEHQIKNDVLKKKSYNGNILGKYFKNDMENCNKI